MFAPFTFRLKTARIAGVVCAGVSGLFALFFIQPSLVYAAAPTEISTQSTNQPIQSNTGVPFDSSVAAPAGIPTGSTAGTAIIPPVGASVETPSTAAEIPTTLPEAVPAPIVPPQGGVQSGKNIQNAVQMTEQDFNSDLLTLREASNRNDVSVAVALSNRLLALSSFPATSAELTPLLRSYIEYFGIKPLLFDKLGSVREAIPQSALQNVRSFLERYTGSALANRMRNDYLLVLGAQKDWANFEAQYRLFTLDDDIKVKAYALIARAQKGENVAAAARALLVDPRQYSDAGIDLITVLAEKKQFSAQDIWTQMRLTYRVNRQSMAKDIARALGTNAPPSHLLDEAAQRPLKLLTDASVNAPNSFMGPQLILLALTQMARYNPSGAATAFAPLASQLTARQRATGWTIIAYWGAVDHCPEALTWYRLAGDAPFSTSTFEWRVRAALFAGAWKEVRIAIEAMPGALQAQSAWVYWLARAMQEEPGVPATLSSASSSPNPNVNSTSTAPIDSRAENQVRARALLASIASNSDFYGLLAREALGRPLLVPNRTIVGQAEVAAVKQNAGFALTQRLYAAGLYFEGSREWNWLLRGMNDRQLLATARYAQQIGLYDRAVNTANRTRGAHDFALRYPTPELAIIKRNAQDANIDLNWVYGLIRQESRFLSKAQSAVGALGLMQVMPYTAKLVVRKIGLNNFELSKLADIQTNTQIGTRYLSMLYEQFERSEVLATAAYNAGPNRAKQWQEALPRKVEGAVFVEMIPFDETRAYVKNVLSNASYYDAMHNNGDKKRQSLMATLGWITPSSSDTE